jgi:hypothetical protein
MPWTALLLLVLLLVQESAMQQAGSCVKPLYLG